MYRVQSEQNQRIKTGNWNEKFIKKVEENKQGLLSFPAANYESSVNVDIVFFIISFTYKFY